MDPNSSPPVSMSMFFHRKAVLPSGMSTEGRLSRRMISHFPDSICQNLPLAADIFSACTISSARLTRNLLKKFPDCVPARLTNRICPIQIFYLSDAAGLQSMQRTLRQLKCSDLHIPHFLCRFDDRYFSAVYGSMIRFPADLSLLPDLLQNLCFTPGSKISYPS